ncbi:MAG TPA: DUF1292 domain-containing protein [Clostridiaceae bacterium]|nr:DUF1292 domain-containing protein [Clostridiaceae bacterium]
MFNYNFVFYAPSDKDNFDAELEDNFLVDESSVVVMEDTETGEEYTFEMVDQFEFEDDMYCVLLTMTDDEDDENFGEWVITRVVEEDGGEISLMSLDEDEVDRIYDEYDRLLDEYAEIDEEDEEDEEDEV